jgi:transposase
VSQSEKNRLLKQYGTFNRQSGKIKEPIFHSNPFFDPHDLAQVKYEMVRQVTHDGKSISDASASFGMSRPTFYQAKEALEREGVLGLAPKKTGPKNRHKLNAEIMAFVEDQLAKDSDIGLAAIADLVQKKFSVSIHQRSIERALAAKKKMSTTMRNR